MMIVGLTGSIGMGKSTVAAMFRASGVPVFDADETVHILQGPNGLLLPEIESAFPGTTNAAGVDRVKLGSEVFGDDDALRRLEKIVHPAVAEERAVFLAANQSSTVVIFDIPLLFEKGGNKAVDVVIVVSASIEVQRARVLARPGMTVEKFEQILARQTPDAEKRERADYVIDTGTPLDVTRQRVAEVIACLASR
ncbi:dephospho-CoA kinase [Sphingomonas paeninsulae]|uniref:Dephospho-CoA kinase n=1 Tax=Sphingomonas paeninsulae TaxID=2319844 RepID=A0A494TNC7_SPHPE|nr:dephospho-CoA kinase [Sphingomonas paeninsulae]AYJ86615.1 dephospho-CoA kinase [Sphingomonas paeninsulae]